ncbi:MAG: alpha/beta fold hydrolase [Candidatus Aenigmarchaeota archaeon]|nr:alpha/beta fold hydrolase [Candidatus Aenigmarchaeota archaeon]
MRGIAVLLLAVVVAGCVQQLPAAQKVSFSTDDNFLIHGNYYEGSEKAVILLHMLGSGKDSWNDFAQQLNKNNYTVLALDMRGHGESTLQYNQTRHWQDFPEDEFSNMLLDAKAAKAFLKERGKVEFAVVGASIGSSIALNQALVDDDTRAAVLLSPGLNYKGVPADYFITLYEKPVMLIASEGDTSSADAAKYMYFFAKGRKELFILSGTGAHGTDMLNNTELDKRIIEWLGRNF